MNRRDTPSDRFDLDVPFSALHSAGGIMGFIFCCDHGSVSRKVKAAAFEDPRHHVPPSISSGCSGGSAQALAATPSNMYPKALGPLM